MKSLLRKAIFLTKVSLPLIYKKRSYIQLERPSYIQLERPSYIQLERPFYSYSRCYESFYFVCSALCARLFDLFLH